MGILLVVVLFTGGYLYLHKTTSSSVGIEDTVDESNKESAVIERDVETASSSLAIDETNSYVLSFEMWGTSERKGSFFITNKQTGTRTALGEPIKNPAPITNRDDFPPEYYASMHESPNGQYVLLTIGTSKAQGNTVYRVVTGVEVARFCATSFVEFWNDVVIYKGCGNEVSDWGYEVGIDGIYGTNLITYETETVVPARVGNDYFMYRIENIVGNVLNYARSKVLPPDATNEYSHYNQKSEEKKSINLSTVP